MGAKTGMQKVLSEDERMMLALRGIILSAFQDKFGNAAIIGVNITPSLLFTRIATVEVHENIPGMMEFAEHVERDITQDLRCKIAIFVKQQRIYHRVARLFKGGKH